MATLIVCAAIQGVKSGEFGLTTLNVSYWPEVRYLCSRSEDPVSALTGQGCNRPEAAIDALRSEGRL